MSHAVSSTPQRVVVAVQADTADEAVIRAKDWAHHEPLRITTLCSVKRGGVNDGQWHVERAVRWLR